MSIKSYISHTIFSYKELAFKIFYLFGVYVSFLISGVYQEKLYKFKFTDEFNNKKLFNQPMITLLINGLISFIIAEIFLYK